jgi:hypothetical protein
VKAPFVFGCSGLSLFPPPKGATQCPFRFSVFPQLSFGQGDFAEASRQRGQRRVVACDQSGELERNGERPAQDIGRGNVLSLGVEGAKNIRQSSCSVEWPEYAREKRQDTTKEKFLAVMSGFDFALRLGR